MKKSFIVSLIALVLAESLIAADVSGVWSLRLTTADPERAHQGVRDAGSRMAKRSPVVA